MYKSKGEEAYASFLEKSEDVIKWEYEPISLKIGINLSYTPDFIVEYQDRLEVIEVKGWSRNIRDGISRFKVAAYLYPRFLEKPVHWKMIQLKTGKWQTKYHFVEGKRYKQKKGKK